MIRSVAILLDLDIVLIGLIGLIYNLKAFFTFFSMRYFQDTVWRQLLPDEATIFDNLDWLAFIRCVRLLEQVRVEQFDHWMALDGVF